ncbi:MAG: hypothetical protein KTR35_20155 [Gammaproteobacteria bacterium]|nr:hypothetical protein [Gammaproteobacteria bacterium]
MRGAGGTPGGEWSFFVGVTMMIVGFYLLLSSIIVNTQFGFGMRMYGIGGFGITSGMILIPFIAGVIMIFYNSRNYFGWFLAIGSIIALIAGVIVNTQFSFRRMTAFELIAILVLCFGGVGFFLRSLRDHRRSEEQH